MTKPAQRKPSLSAAAREELADFLYRRFSVNIIVNFPDRSETPFSNLPDRVKWIWLDQADVVFDAVNSAVGGERK